MNRFLIFILIVGATIPQHTGEEQHLLFILSAEKSTYSVYEPIVLNMAVVNKGRQRVQGEFDCFSFDCKDLSLFYRKRGEQQFKRYYSGIIWAASIKHIMRLGEKPILLPESRVSSREIVLFDYQPISNQENKFVFTEPSEYEFRATFQYILENPSRVIESNVLRLTVVNPPEQEREALSWWKDQALALAVQGDSVSMEGVRKLRMFLQKFHNSLYATAARNASERLRSYLTQKAKEKKLTEDEKELYALIRLND
jgi:hypothetical protein